MKRAFGVFRIYQCQHNNRSPLDVGFDFWFWNVNVKVFVIVKFFYVQVNRTQGCIYKTFKHHLMVVLEVLFHNEIIYEMGPPMLEKQVKEFQSRVAPTLFAQAGVGA